MKPSVPAYALGGGYAALGLVGNPFAAEQQPGVAPALWVPRGDEPAPPQPGQRRLVQLIGPKGAGKTSLLLRWRAAQPGPYHYVAPGLPRWRFPPTAHLVYWDEVDRMAKPVRLAALLLAAARGATIVAGTHCDLAVLAGRCGLAVETYEFPLLNLPLLHRWAERRIAQAQLPGRSATLALDPATATMILEQVGPSWREAAVLLHIWAAQQAAQHAAEPGGAAWK